ncbi:MAG: hypothetical protein QW520_02255 [Methanomassiliicoccales archaeon]
MEAKLHLSIRPNGRGIMPDIGQMIIDFFKGLGLIGLLLSVFFIFYIDAILFPTLPELFVILIFFAGQELMPEFQWEFAVLILLTIAMAEIAGVLTLYNLVRRIKVPTRIEKVIMKYRDFLLVRDERMILVNRIAPILPFLGAFVAICKWSLRKTLFYTVLGGMLKYGIILAAAGYLVYYFEAGVARLVTFLLVLIIIGISFALSFYRKRRLGEVCANPPT